MIRKVMIAALLVAMPATAVLADEPAKTEKPAKEKKICRRDAHTGSIMQKQTCHTAQEWADIDTAARRNGISHNGDSGRTVDVH